MAVERDNKTGFICSSFDIYHTGYSLMLKYCKDHCDYLVVGLQDDPSWQRSEKNSPVMSLHSRWLILKSISYIDEIAPYNSEEELSNLLNFYTPDVRFLGEDYINAKTYTGPAGPNSITPWNKRVNTGMTMSGHYKNDSFHFIPRKHSYSSSGIREKIYEAEKYKSEVKEFSHHNQM